MNNNQPLVSVIIPIYKVEKYLPACIDSVLSQTYHNLEIILVDDGSPDRCGAICDAYAAKDSRIKVIHKENGGLSDARNAGMKIAEGEYLYFLDSDDLIHPEAIARLAQVLQTHQADLVCGGHVRFKDGTAPSPVISNLRPQVLDQQSAMTRFVVKDWGAWGKLYRRQVHLGIDFPVRKIHEDEAIMLQILDRCRTVAIVDDQLYYYRGRSGSITAQSYSIRKMDWMNGWIANVNFALANYPSIYPQCLSKAWTVAMYNIGHLLGNPDHQEQLEIITQFVRRHFIKILFNSHLSAAARLRVLIYRISNTKKDNCLYRRFYTAVSKVKGNNHG